MPGDDPFRVKLLTAAATRGYLDSLKAAGRAPRTQAKAITSLQRFCRWTQDKCLLRRNPVAQIERPTFTALAPAEFMPKPAMWSIPWSSARNSRRLAASVALAYDEDYRRRIHHTMNKGELLHTLAREVFFGQQGLFRERDYEG